MSAMKASRDPEAVKDKGTEKKGLLSPDEVQEIIKGKLS